MLLGSPAAAAPEQDKGVLLSKVVCAVSLYSCLLGDYDFFLFIYLFIYLFIIFFKNFLFIIIIILR